MKDKRIVELIEFAAAEGFDLPIPAERIVEVEDAGGIVDLCTGIILPGAANWLVEPTIVGEATAVVLEAVQGTTK